MYLLFVYFKDPDIPRCCIGTVASFSEATAAAVSAGPDWFVGFERINPIACFGQWSHEFVAASALQKKYANELGSFMPL